MSVKSIEMIIFACRDACASHNHPFVCQVGEKKNEGLGILAMGGIENG